MIFVVFHLFRFTKSQVPTLIHSIHNIFSLFHFLTQSLSYLISHPIFILSSHLVILDIKDNQIYSVYLETHILRSTKEDLSTGELPARHRCSAAYWAECEQHRGGAVNVNERATGDLLPSAVNLRYTT